MNPGDFVKWYDVASDTDKVGQLGKRGTLEDPTGMFDGLPVWDVYDEYGNEYVVDESTLQLDPVRSS